MDIKLFIRSGPNIEDLKKEALEFFKTGSRVPLGGELKPAPVGYVVYVAYKEDDQNDIT